MSGVHRLLRQKGRLRGSPGVVARLAAPPGPGDPTALFSFDGIQVVRAGRQVLDIDHATIPLRGATGIVGPSGAGKSTLLRLCNRLESPSAGIVRFRNGDLAATDPLQHRRDVAMVFQHPVALPGTVADNLREADPTLDDAAVEVGLAAVGLPADVATRVADELSGGERQRVSLARSMATRPHVLLLDEATSALDATSAGRIETLVGTLAASGIIPIWVSHDIEQVRRVAEHVLVIIDGRVAQAGPVDQVLAGPRPDVRRFIEGTMS